MLDAFTIAQLVEEFGSIKARIPRQMAISPTSINLVRNWTGLKYMTTCFFILFSFCTIPYAREHFWIMISALQICFFFGFVSVSWPVDAVLAFKLLEGVVFFDIGINSAIMKALSPDSE